MKLLYILSGYPNYSEVFIQNEVERLAKEGYEVSVLDIRSSNTRTVNGIKVYSNSLSVVKIVSAWFTHPIINSKGFISPVSFIRHRKIGLKSILLFLSLPYLKKKVKEIDPDQIVGHFLFTASHAAATLATSLNIPYHIRLHTSYSTLPPRCRHNVLKNADSLSAISLKLKDYYKQSLRENKFIDLIRQDIDLSKLELTKKSTYPVDNHFVAIGRLVPKKGFIELLDGLYEYKYKYNSAFSLNIYGDGPLRKVLENKIITLGLQDHVYLVGKMKHTELMAKLSNASVLLVPSSNTEQDVDGIPSVMIEAMYLKTLVIGTQVGGMDEILKDEVTGFVMPDLLPTTIAQTIYRSFESLEKWDEIKEQAKTKIIEEYSKKLSF